MFKAFSFIYCVNLMMFLAYFLSELACECWFIYNLLSIWKRCINSFRKIHFHDKIPFFFSQIVFLKNNLWMLLFLIFHHLGCSHIYLLRKDFAQKSFLRQLDTSNVKMQHKNIVQRSSTKFKKTRASLL